MVVTDLWVSTVCALNVCLSLLLVLNELLRLFLDRLIISSPLRVCLCPFLACIKILGHHMHRWVRLDLRTETMGVKSSDHYLLLWGDQGRSGWGRAKGASQGPIRKTPIWVSIPELPLSLQSSRWLSSTHYSNSRLRNVSNNLGRIR